MEHARWRMGFHLMPPTGWLNDPNGLCQFKGIYHVFHQYSPEWPAPHAARGWGHFSSSDLVHWQSFGEAIVPDTPDEASGSYSGCATIVSGAAADGGDLLRLYYTGNVKEPGDYDYIHAGRRSTQILVESENGFDYTDKRVLLRNADYPANCTCHVRDPKVWQAGGSWWMILGARDLNDRGLVLVLRSDDGISWENAGRISSVESFGYMWECPDRIELDGHVFLSCCPQGMQDYPWAFGMRDQSGYFILPARADIAAGEQHVSPADFRLWDWGFDFYAPQTFTDEQGRTILIGWMGVPDAPFDSAPDGLTWCHCLTVPRLLTLAPDGSILQNPVPELKDLRESAWPLNAPGTTVVEQHRADLEIEGVQDDLAVTLDGTLSIRYADGTLSLTFMDADGIGAGRTERSCPLEHLEDLRILVDDSAVELFANGGRIAMATRWFPTAGTLAVHIDGYCVSARIWDMGDGMLGTY